MNNFQQPSQVLAVLRNGGSSYVRWWRSPLSAGRILVIAIWCIFLLIGCQGPTGQMVDRSPRGPLGVGGSASTGLLSVELESFIDQTAQQLAEDLARLPQVDSAPGRVTIAVTGIQNRTGNLSEEQFETITSRIFAALSTSRYERDKIRLIAQDGALMGLESRELGLSEGLRPSAGGVQTYTLSGDLHRTRRGKNNHYHLEFQVIHFTDGQTIFSKRYDTPQAIQAASQHTTVSG